MKEKVYRVYGYGNPMRVWIAIGPVEYNPDTIFKLRDAHGFETEAFASDLKFG